MQKPKLFLDMDNTLVDTLSVLNTADPVPFDVAKPDQIPGIFRHLDPLPGAIEAVNTLAQHYDLWILSTAPWHNPSAWSDKLLWLSEHFGHDEASPFYKKVVLAHDKAVAKGHGGILIDDRPYHGASPWDDETIGTMWVQYGYDSSLTWESGELVTLLLDAAYYYQTHQVTERQALLAVGSQRTLHGDVTSFEKAHWE
jgi:5'(3')-deoxyribonucleotidase